MRMIIDRIAKNGTRFLLAAALTVGGGAAQAATIISSNATDVKVSLTLLNFLPTSLTLATASGTTGTTGTPYNNSSQLLAATQAAGFAALIGEYVTTGTGTATAQSNGTTGSGNATVNSLGLNLSALFASSLALNSGMITSTTTFDGASLTGMSSIADLTLGNNAAALANVNGSALLSTGANRTLVDIAGLKITLNEQIGAESVSNGIYNRSLTTNALRVTYNNFAFDGGLLNGDLIVGQSQVNVAQAVPEPATWALMLVGFGMVGGALRSQRRRPAVASA